MEQIRQAGADLDLSEMVQAVETYFLTATEKATTGGENVSEGIATGVMNKEQDAVDAIHGVAEKMDADFTKFNGIASPAKLYEDHGKNIDEGLAKGITDSTEKVLSAMRSMTERLTNATEQQLRELDRRMVDIIDDLPGEFRVVGAQTMDGFTYGFESRSGALYYAVESVMNTAIAKAKRTAAIASPSKRTKEIGENLDEGVIVGIKEKEAAVVDATSGLMEKALAAAAGVAGAPEIGPINDRMPRLGGYDDGAGGIARAIESAFAGIRAPAGGQNVNITVEIPLDGQTLARKTYRYFQREGARLGGDLVEVAG